MPTQYIGRHSFFKGKSLFDLVLNLNNFGVDRVVCRVTFMERYKEPSYYRLTTVVPDMTSEFRHKGEVYGQRVFRGMDYGLSQIESGHKFDWMLVPKDQEKSFCLSEFTPKKEIAVESMKPLPPTMELYMKQLMKDGHQVVPKKILVKNRVCYSRNRLYKPHDQFEIHHLSSMV